jgi:lysophospholipase
MTRARIDRRAVPAGAFFTGWQAPDGWQYRRLNWPLPKHVRARGSLLFAGGRGDFIEKYIEVLHHWHAQGWHVTAFDWRSQGGSRGHIVRGHLDSLDPLVDDLAALIEDWRASAPAPHVAVAHSMGGHVLLRTLAEGRAHLDAAVLIAPMLGINSGVLPPWLAAWTAATMRFIGWDRLPVWRSSTPPPPVGSLRQSYLTGCRDRYEDELWWWQKEPGYNLGTPSWGWLDAAYRSCARLTPERLAEVSTPILLLGTERDRLVSPQAIKRAARLVPGAELLMFEEAGHEILREADRVRLQALDTIDLFLDRHAMQRADLAP